MRIASLRIHRGARFPQLRRLRAAVALLASARALAVAAESKWTVHDPTFAHAIVTDAAPELLASGFAGCEGAQWSDDDGGHLRFAGVHTDVALRWDVRLGLRALRAPSGEPSAFRPHPEGWVVAEQGTRRIMRYHSDGSVSVLAEHFEGKRLNRPNDVAVRRDGTVWFTDPDYLFAVSRHEKKGAAGQLRVPP